MQKQEKTDTILCCNIPSQTTLPTKMPWVKKSKASSEAKAQTEHVQGFHQRDSSALRITWDQSLIKILSKA
jgi:hypothetical protein